MRASTLGPILFPMLLLAGCGSRTDLELTPLVCGEIADGGHDAARDRFVPIDVVSEGFEENVVFEDAEGFQDGFPVDGEEGDGGGCPASTAGFTPMPYTPAVAGQNACTPAQIEAFITACGDSGTESSCNAWVMANLEPDGGGITPCGSCIFAPNDNGGVWSDPEGFFEPNYAACIQLTDPVNGPKCAAAYDDLSGCIGVACDTCTTDSSYTGCASSVETTGGECATYGEDEKTACKTDLADGGAASTCSPGSATMTLDPDLKYIITLICGPP